MDVRSGNSAGPRKGMECESNSMLDRGSREPRICLTSKLALKLGRMSFYSKQTRCENREGES